jgi:catechol 2,3-dioxygenase-like lactoylglutathione lyase family enzyme
MRLEVVVIPVADVDRAKDFYKALGWREDADFTGDAGFRVVQVTPPARRARSSSVAASPRPRRAPPRACSWWWTTSTGPGPS